MAEWTLMNAPSARSKDNTRAGIAVTTTDSNTAAQPLTTAQLDLLKDQPPMYLLLTRKSPTTTELTNLATNTPLYTIRDTGRGSLSSKPDFEIFRPQSGNVFVGSIRFGRSGGTQIKLPLTNRKHDEAESFTSTDRKAQKWTQSHVGRNKSVDRSNFESVKALAEPDWIVVLDCYPTASGNGDRTCAVKLFDSMPNGRVEIWDRAACVDVGGDWNVLDELVVVAYANMEKARRKIMKGPDPNGVGFAGLAVGGGAM